MRVRIYEIYSAIRQFLQPYWIPDPKKLGKRVVSNDKVSGKALEKEEIEPIEETGIIEKELQKIDSVRPGETLSGREMVEKTGLTVVTYPEPLGKIWESEQLPPPQHVWYYHDEKVHEIFSHLMPGSGRKFTNRSQRARNRLRPLIYPRIERPFDRTHLIPFGYHGSEADARLLIGWDSEQNRGPMNEFEKKQKRRNMPIYWLCRVEKTSSGAKLTYTTWDARNMHLLDSEEFVMNCPFVWKG